jgi:hypothetical protein
MRLLPGAAVALFTPIDATSDPRQHFGFQPRYGVG